MLPIGARHYVLYPVKVCTAHVSSVCGVHASEPSRGESPTLSASVEVARMGTFQQLGPSRTTRRNDMENAGTNTTVCSGMLAPPGGIKVGISLGSHVEGMSQHTPFIGNHHREQMVEKLPAPL